MKMNFHMIVSSSAAILATVLYLWKRKKQRSNASPASEVARFMKRIYEAHLTTTSGGNVSVCDSNRTVWITPSGTDKANVVEEEVAFAVLSEDNVHWSGPLKPSIEWPFHTALYKLRSDIRGIVHAHSHSLLTIACSGGSLDTNALPFVHNYCGDTVVASYRTPGSSELADVVSAALENGGYCVIMENHGVVVGGKSLEEACCRFEILESFAAASLRALLLKKVPVLPFKDESEKLQAFCRGDCAVGICPFEPSWDDKEKRVQICNFAHRGYKQKLFCSVGGTISIRVNESCFLISPVDADNSKLSPDDICFVQFEKGEYGIDPVMSTGSPSMSVLQHCSIYADCPHVNSIIEACPINVGAYCMTRTPFNSTVSPEGYIVLRSVQTICISDYVESVRLGAEFQHPASRVALVDNVGAISTGKSILQAFDCLEVLEAVMRVVISSNLSGGISEMDEERRKDIDKVFKL